MQVKTNHKIAKVIVFLDDDKATDNNKTDEFRNRKEGILRHTDSKRLGIIEECLGNQLCNSNSK